MAVKTQAVTLPPNVRNPGLTQGADYDDAARQQALATLLTQRALTPAQSVAEPAGNVLAKGFTQLAQALLASRVQQQAKATQTAANTRESGMNSDLIRSMLPAQPTQLGGIDDQNGPVTLDSQKSDTVGGAPMSDQGLGLQQALAGQDPRQVNALLAQARMAQLMPKAPAADYTLNQSDTRIDGATNKPLATGMPKELAPKGLQHTESGLTFDPTTGKYTDSNGAAVSSDEVARREAKVAGWRSAATAQAGLPASGKADAGTVGMLKTGMPLTQVIPGYSKATVMERSAARDATIASIMQDNPGMSEMDAGSELARRQVDYVAGKSSVTQLTKMLGASDVAVKQLDFNVDSATSEMAKLKSTDLSPILNAIIRQQEKWTGDPAYSSLFFYMSGAAKEAARLQSNGQASIAQLNQGAADEAQKWANINMTPASWAAVSSAMKSEGRARVQQFQSSIRTMGGRDGDGADQAGTAKTSFASEAEAEAAEKAGTLQKGAKITIGGVPGTWQ